MAHLGDKLKEYRKTKSWNQFEMSDYLGFSNRKYQDIENTGKVGKVEDLQIITQKTGIDTQKIAYEVAPDKTKKKIESVENKATKKDLSSLIESNLILSRSIEKNTNNLSDMVQLYKEKSVPISFDLIGLVEEVRQLHVKVDALLRPQVEQAEEELRQEAGRFVDDRDKEAHEIAERLRKSGRHGHGKTGKK